MNVADSQQVASALEHLGYVMTAHPDEADVIVLNTCVVRQSAEDKATGRLMSLRPLKERNPQLVINLMGCLVGIKDNPQLKKRFPFVDVFSPPSDPQPLLAFLTQQADRSTEEELTAQRFAWMDEEIQLPTHQKGRTVSAFVPVVLGCSHACTYCIIPYRRGVEVSRPPEQILSQVRSLAAQGVREITLLGQIVDRYGNRLPYANQPVSLELDGPADLIGENPFAVMGGQGAVYVRARHEPGLVTVRAVTPRLKAQSVTITIR